MSGGGDLIPSGDDQAKAAQEIAKATQEALKTLQGVGGFLREVFGTVPEDLVGLCGGDWLKARRLENLARIFQKSKKRLEARNAAHELPSPSLLVPLIIAAADESRDELQDMWASLLAAAADPTRAKAFRLAFIETAKKMDPLDAAVLKRAPTDGRFTDGRRNELAAALFSTRDEIDVSIENLANLGLARRLNDMTVAVVPFGREFLRSVSD